jgi:hypothetical protein
VRWIRKLQFDGVISVNGCSISDASTVSALRTLLGFVAKEDVVDRRLTPRELFTLSARQHLPAGTPAARVRAAVDRTLSVLSLDGVADVVVGGGTTAAANISGGQLKRVSVGIELVCEPRALILDGMHELDDFCQFYGCFQWFVVLLACRANFRARRDGSTRSDPGMPSLRSWKCSQDFGNIGMMDIIFSAVLYFCMFWIQFPLFSSASGA